LTSGVEELAAAVADSMVGLYKTLLSQQWAK
jgi:hypothetical protein